MRHRVNDFVERAVRISHRLDRYYRDAFDRTLRDPLVAVVQALINFTRRDPLLPIAGERAFPNEDALAHEIAGLICRFVERTYRGSVALRGGNTKTYGLVKASFEVLANLPAELRQGLFAAPRAYDAWVRFAGPGPLAPPDIDDNGVLSFSIKVMGVDGPKLAEDEQYTQDFTALSAPTFPTPNLPEIIKLERRILDGTPALYFLDPRDSHILDLLMQGLFARANANPLELNYYSCVPYLHGEGQAVKFYYHSTAPRVSKVPRHPGPNYLREAMTATLANRTVVFNVLVQRQTNPRTMPVENASVIWPTRESPLVPVARVTIPPQRFDSPEQLSFDRYLSFNPWHSLPAHRPLGNQNRARRIIYAEAARCRMAMNGDRHIEPSADFVLGPSRARSTGRFG
jgi:hypothetical protein